MDFHKILTSRLLVTDGAMGTYYREKYGGTSRAPELDNLEAPERIRAIHREYIEAGADIIRTNSFASNVQTLCPDGSGQTREARLRAVYENVTAACRIAKAAVKESGCGLAGEEEDGRGQNREKVREKLRREIYIAGDIGPVPEQGGADERDEALIEEYKTIAKAHLDAGIRLIWFETFPDLERILPVAEWIRSVSSAFIMVSFSVNVFGYTQTGIGMGELLKAVKESALIDGIGFNCGIGPSHLSRLLKRQDMGELIVSAVPNAGYADRIENRMVYRDNSAYFCEAMKEIAGLGVNIIGGCCGTSPSYTRKLAAAVGHRSPAKRLSDRPEERAESEIRYDHNPFIRKLYSGEKVVIAELDPPFDGNDRKMMDAAIKCNGPVYIRINRNDLPVLTDPDAEYHIGKMDRLRDGKDAVIFATGVMVSKSLEAAENLEKQGISCRVVNVSTIKPLDAEALKANIQGMKAVVTAEEHNKYCGLGSAIAEALSEERIPIGMVAVDDRFGTSAKNYDELLDAYGLTAEAIEKKAASMLSD